MKENQDPFVHTPNPEDKEDDDRKQCTIDFSRAPKFVKCRQQYLQVTLPKHFTLFENILRRNSESAVSNIAATDGVVWLVGDSLTYADFILAEYTSQHLLFAPTELARFPMISRHHSAFYLLPAVKAYIDSSKFKAEPLHNRYSHFHEGWVK